MFSFCKKRKTAGRIIRANRHAGELSRQRDERTTSGRLVETNPGEYKKHGQEGVHRGDQTDLA
jgi:hypothetical protein